MDYCAHYATRFCVPNQRRADQSFPAERTYLTLLRSNELFFLHDRLDRFVLVLLGHHVVQRAGAPRRLPG